MFKNKLHKFYPVYASILRWLHPASFPYRNAVTIVRFAIGALSQCERAFTAVRFLLNGAPKDALPRHGTAPFAKLAQTERMVLV